MRWGIQCTCNVHIIFIQYILFTARQTTKISIPCTICGYECNIQKVCVLCYHHTHYLPYIPSSIYRQQIGVNCDVFPFLRATREIMAHNSLCMFFLAYGPQQCYTLVQMFLFSLQSSTMLYLSTDFKHSCV